MAERTRPNNTNQASLATASDWVFFAAADLFGTELWRTDGLTMARLTDIAPGADDADPEHITPSGSGLVFFSADDGSAGRELWVWDGTAATRHDLAPGADDSDPAGFIRGRGGVYFTADDAFGRELWFSDGGADQRLTDLAPGAASADPEELTLRGQAVWFSADDGTHGRELWRWHPTAGLRLVDLAASGGSEPEDITLAGRRLYFTADDGVHGRELYWVGTGGKVHRTNIAPGAADAFPDLGADPQLVAVGNSVYFFATDATSGVVTLWSAGPGGAKPLVEVDNGFGRHPTGLTAVDGALYFAAGGADRELWRWGDGALTRLEVMPGPAGSDPEQLTAIGGTLWFTAENGRDLLPFNTTGEHYRDWWTVKDGDLVRMDAVGRSFLQSEIAAAGDTAVVSNLGYLWTVAADGTVTRLDGGGAGSLGSNPVGFAGLGGETYFFASDALHGQELWHIGADGAVLAADIDPGAVGSQPFLALGERALQPFGDELFFFGSGHEIWEWGGGGLRQAGSFYIQDHFAVAGNDLYAIENTGTLQHYDGQSFNPVALAGGPSTAALGGRLFYAGSDAAHGTELWALDGGTPSLVADLAPGTAGSDPSDLTTADGALFFAAAGQVWTLDGGGPRAIAADTAPGQPHDFTAAGERVFFALDDGSHGRELWLHDGVGTRLAADLAPGAASGAPTELTALGDTLYFAALDGLWRHDGSGATQVAGLAPRDLTAVGDRLYFSGDDGSHGRELWMLEGGALVLTDLNPGAASSAPTALAAIGEALYLSADDGVHGAEPWRHDGTSAALVEVNTDGLPIAPFGLGVPPDVLLLS